MKPAAILAALALSILLATPGDAATKKGQTITLDDDELRVCVEGGGCALITRRAFEELRDAAMACRSRGSV